MIYGPTAAFLVEIFPAQIRYTGVSLSYHLGTGVFGGFTPLIALSSSSQGNQLGGLVYPVVITALTFVVFFFVLRKGTHSVVARRAGQRFEDTATLTSPVADVTDLAR